MSSLNLNPLSGDVVRLLPRARVVDESSSDEVESVVAHLGPAEIRVSQSPERGPSGCEIFLALDVGSTVTVEVQGPDPETALDELRRVIGLLPIGVPELRRESFVGGVLKALVEFDDETVTAVARAYGIGPREALTAVAALGGLDPLAALLTTVDRDRPQILSLDPAYAPFDGDLKATAPWHDAALGLVAEFFPDPDGWDDLTPVAFWLQADDPQERSRFAGLLAELAQEQLNTTILRSPGLARRLRHERMLRLTSFAIVDVELTSDAERDQIAAFLRDSKYDSPEGVVVLSATGDARAEALWRQVAPSKSRHETLLFSPVLLQVLADDEADEA